MNVALQSVSLSMCGCSRIMRVESADEFYTAMGSIAQDMLDNSIIGADELVKVRTRELSHFYSAN